MTENSGVHTKRAAVIVNPVKKGAEEFKKSFFSLCAAEGWAEPLWIETTEEDPGAGQTKEALAAGVDVVIAAGGDGTVREVAENLAHTDTPLGLVPMGTGNLLARNLGLDITDIDNAAAQVLSGIPRQIDVVTMSLDRSAKEKVFLVMAGLGFDAVIMSDTNDDLKDRVGWLAYVEAGLRNLPGKPVRTTVTVDGHRVSRHRIRSVMVGNCGKLMGGVEVFPDAAVDDGLLDIVVMAPKGKLGWLNVLGGVVTKKSKNNSSLEYFAGKSAEISLEHPQEFQLDGDHLGKASHLRVTVAAKALSVIVPREDAQIG